MDCWVESAVWVAACWVGGPLQAADASTLADTKRKLISFIDFAIGGDTNLGKSSFFELSIELGPYKHNGSGAFAQTLAATHLFKPKQDWLRATSNTHFCGVMIISKLSFH